MRGEQLTFAYADPPYFGCCGSHYGHDHREPYGCWDEPEAHKRLVETLMGEFPDGWALSLHVPSLRFMLNLLPENVRVAVWCKSFAVFRKGVNPAYAWEPVIFYGGRGWKERGGNECPTTRDFLVCPITMQRGVKGAKPDEFCRWVFDLLGATPDDLLVDLFPGSGAVGRAWDSFVSQPRLIA